MSPALSIAMLGTRGVPAHYGGFETAVEEVGRRLAAAGHQVTVYCRPGNAAPASATYLGMKLVTLPVVRRRSLETLIHTGISVAHLLAHRTDVAFMFNAANAPWLPLLRSARIPVATHVDGLEWKRGKWGPSGQKYYRWAEAGSVRWSDALIADAAGIQKYYLEEFSAQTELIAYGAPHLLGMRFDRLQELGLRPQEYHLVVARFEPENHVDLIIDGYLRSGATKPLVVVGGAPYAKTYSTVIDELAARDSRIVLLGGIWDQELLDQLYAGALTYVHGHSVGGTNPSLLRAIGAGTATIGYDVVFNREVLGDDAWFFADRDGLAHALNEAETKPDLRSRRAQASVAQALRYDWEDVALSYERLAYALRDGHVPGRQRGRRVTGPPAAHDLGESVFL